MRHVTVLVLQKSMHPPVHDDILVVRVVSEVFLVDGRAASIFVMSCVAFWIIRTVAVAISETGRGRGSGFPSASCKADCCCNISGASMFCSILVCRMLK